MPPYLASLFGLKKPTTAAIDVALGRVEAELAAAPGRIAAAEAALQHVASMTDVEHAAAEDELAAARRSLIRLQARVAELQEARAAAAKAEAEAALRIKRATVQKRADGMKALLDRYDMAARATADAAEAIDVVDDEIAAFNREAEVARRTGLDAPASIATSHEVFRFEPGRAEPNRTMRKTIWEVPTGDGRWTEAGVLAARGGDEMIAPFPSARKRDIDEVIPGRRRPGRSIDTPTAGLSLPPSRLGGETHWPRSGR